MAIGETVLDGPERRRSVAFLVRHRFAVAMVIDSLLITVAVFLAAALRYEFDLAQIDWPATLAFAALGVTLQLLFGGLQRVHSGATRYGSFDEVAGLVVSMSATTVFSALINRYLFDRLVPVSVSVLFGLIALILMGGVRYGWRMRLERQLRPSAEAAQPVVVFGAGEGGAQIITAMLRNPNSPYLPKAIVDDDPFKTNLRINRVPVMGNLDDLATVAAEVKATAMIIAVPSAETATIRRATQLADQAQLETLVLPPVRELLGSLNVGDIRPITEEDLLGRGRIETDVESIAGYLANRCVLVTGAGGSIGSELCRQIHRYGPSDLVMLDRDESGLHSTQLSIDGRGQLETRALVVADIRDADRIDEVFAEWRPDVVFHAAALKHVPLLEMYPEEAHKTNVVGTANLLDAAERHDVERFVNISTDKAADPINVLGFTKRQAERLTACRARSTGRDFMSVRFGNVLGSRGSVLTAFHEQIARGGPVTVTHPDVTRYFMTVHEAVELVVQAGAIGSGGEILILDMGEPVRIADVAQRMVEAAEGHIDIVYTGLRRGEKLHEVLLAADERGAGRHHPLITHVEVDDNVDPGNEVIHLEPGGVTIDLTHTASNGTARTG